MVDEFGTTEGFFRYLGEFVGPAADARLAAFVETSAQPWRLRAGALKAISNKKLRADLCAHVLLSNSERIHELDVVAIECGDDRCVDWVLKNNRRELLAAALQRAAEITVSAERAGQLAPLMLMHMGSDDLRTAAMKALASLPILVALPPGFR
jgi:hypothetical protein